MSMSSRRRATRRPRRVQVHFWRQGDPTAYIGYTTNISLTGMFIATNSPIASGARVRIEVVDRGRGFVVEGVVAHARKSPPELARLNQSGMGIRFLSVEELVRELMPAGLAGTEEIPREAAPRPEPPPPPPPPDVTEAFPAAAPPWRGSSCKARSNSAIAPSRSPAISSAQPRSARAVATGRRAAAARKCVTASAVIVSAMYAWPSVVRTSQSRSAAGSAGVSSATASAARCAATRQRASHARVITDEGSRPNARSSACVAGASCPDKYSPRP